MNPEAWVALATVFVLGAMSPGPSLAVVLRNTMVGGRRQGVMTGIGHGIGFGIYAFLAAAGIATALSLHDSTEQILKWEESHYCFGSGIISQRRQWAKPTNPLMMTMGHLIDWFPTRLCYRSA